MKQISHNLNYLGHHLEDLFFPLFERNYIYESLRVTIESANHIWCVYMVNVLLFLCIHY